MAETAETLKQTTNHDVIGTTALRGAKIEYRELGINDPNTHLAQYIEYGESTMEFIEEDLITDCGERMVDAKFINQVIFRRVGTDFLSEIGNFSMTRITDNTVTKMNFLRAEEPLRIRASIEAHTPYHLYDWLPQAEVDESMVEESVPLADEESYAVSRFYRKIDNDTIAMYVIILHNPTVEIFNMTRAKMGAGTTSSVDALELLKNRYTIKPDEGSSFEDHLRKYVDTYDSVLAAHNPDQTFIFGLQHDEQSELPDSLSIIREQKSLLCIYKDTIRHLARSNWVVSKELVSIDEQLQLGMELVEGCQLNLEDSRTMLDGVQQFILATLNRASKETLNALASDEHIQSAYTMAGYYGNEARSEGVRYENPACPTVLSSASVNEMAIAQKAFRHEADPTKCVKCRFCNGIVDLPKKLYNMKIVHCVKCKASVHKDGKKVDQKIIDEFYAKSHKAKDAKKETDWQRIVREDEQKKLRQRLERQETERLKKAVSF